MRQTICWINGKWHPALTALVSPLERTYLYGDGVFEVLRGQAGRFFRLDKHIARLYRGIEVIGCNAGEQVSEAIKALPKAFDHLESEEIIVRITVSGGLGWQDMADHSGGAVTILARPAPSVPPEPARAVLSSVMRDPASPLAEINSCNALLNALARREAEGLGFDEAVLLNHTGALCDTTAGNLFWVSKGVAYTPAVECGAMPGVTREAVLQAAETAGISLQIGMYPAQHLRQAETAFVTNSLFTILPLVSFGEDPLLEDDREGITSSLKSSLKRLIEIETQVWV